MKLRACTPQDAKAVLELWKAARTAGSLTDTAEAIVRRLERDPDLFVLAETDGRLAVHPDFRRRGVAGALVREVERRLRERGARRITALVLHAQDGAEDFWSAAGYAHYDSIRRYVRDL